MKKGKDSSGKFCRAVDAAGKSPGEPTGIAYRQSIFKLPPEKVSMAVAVLQILFANMRQFRYMNSPQLGVGEKLLKW